MRFSALVFTLFCVALPVHAQDALSGGTVTPFDSIAFALEAPDQPQSLGQLWGDRAVGPAGTYLRTPGGWVAPLHVHTADYKAVVIKGIWSHWGAGVTAKEPLPPGSYWTQVAHEPHSDACLSKEDCVVLLINEQPYQTELVSP